MYIGNATTLYVQIVRVPFKKYHDNLMWSCSYWSRYFTEPLLIAFDTYVQLFTYDG